MISDLTVKNFKSLRNLDLKCRRVNLFIGEPNAGKSNLLEALGLLSSTKYGMSTELVRFESISNLFYDDVVDRPIEVRGRIELGDGSHSPFELSIGYIENSFQWMLKMASTQDVVFHSDYNRITAINLQDHMHFIKFYRYKSLNSFTTLDAGSLLPPNGSNLFALIKSRKKVRSMVFELLRSYGLKTVLKPQEHKIEVSKEYEDAFVIFPYISVSDTLKRIIFFSAAMETNEGASLVFEEPESNTFPYFTKELAENIGLDPKQNQYFITTHNPYFLKSVIEKTPTNELTVNITYMKEYQTQIKVMKTEEISEMLDLDEPFFNLERYVDS